MKKFLKSRWFLAVTLLIIASLACASMPSLSAMPKFLAKPGTSNVPTGASPMSGDWNADTQFGHFAFTVDPNGNNAVTAVVDISSFTCGGTFLTTNPQVWDSWPISYGEFSGEIDDLGRNDLMSMRIHGTYNQSGKTFTGTWDEDADSATCSGRWEAIPRK